MVTNNRLPISLFFLRLGIFVVMFIWTIDKFVRPDHSAVVYESFYFISGLGSTPVYIIGALELVILMGFLAGFMKKWTYGAVFLFHAVSTLSSFKQYLSPFESVHLLFFAAWPMLAACFTLYCLRDQDTLFAIEKE